MASQVAAYLWDGLRPCCVVCSGVWLWVLISQSVLEHVTRKGLGSPISKEGAKLRLNEQGGLSSHGRIPSPLFVDLHCRTLDCHGGATVNLSRHWNPLSP